MSSGLGSFSPVATLVSSSEVATCTSYRPACEHSLYTIASPSIIPAIDQPKCVCAMLTYCLLRFCALYVRTVEPLYKGHSE